MPMAAEFPNTVTQTTLLEMLASMSAKPTQ